MELERGEAERIAIIEEDAAERREYEAEARAELEAEREAADLDEAIADLARRVAAYGTARAITGMAMRASSAEAKYRNLMDTPRRGRTLPDRFGPKRDGEPIERPVTWYDRAISRRWSAHYRLVDALARMAAER